MTSPQQSIDVHLHSLAAPMRAAGSAKPHVPTDTATGGAPGAGKTFFLETFGCQMNVHDSEKVAGVLMARGYRPVETPDEADMVLYNTCSIREKAAQKVFSRLGAFRKTRGERQRSLECWAAWRSRKAKRFSSARRR